MHSQTRMAGWVDVPKIDLQDRIQRRTAEQIADFPASQDVEELVFKVFFEDKVQHRFVEQVAEVRPRYRAKTKLCSEPVISFSILPRRR